MITGTLVYDYSSGRLDIISQEGESCGGLYCGNVIEILTEPGTWVSTRVEYAQDEWFLTGLYKTGEIPYGLTARYR